MKLQRKTLLVFVVLLIAVLISTSIFFSTVLLASYSALEEQYIEKDLSQAVNKLNDELFSMSNIVSDWGPWDDTVDFVNGNDPQYIGSNLQPYGFDNLNLNLIVMTNVKGEIIFSGAYDLQNKVMVPIPAFFSGQLDLKNPLMNMSDSHQINAGILMLPENPMLVVSHPIVKSDFSGQPQGVVIMGRYLDREEIARLAALTQPSLTLTRTDDPVLSPSIISRIRYNRGSAPGIIQQLNTDHIAGYALVRDIYGKDALVLQITETRDIYKQGMNTTMQVLIIILAGGLFLGLVVIILLDREVLKRIGSLALQVNKISKSGITVDHVVITGDDELSELAMEINRMLETIEKFHTKLGASEARFREMSDLLPQIIFELDTNANVTYVNKFGKELFGVSENDLKKGLNARQLIIPEDIERVGRNLKKVAAGEKSPGEVYTLIKKDKSTLRVIMFTSPIIREGRLEGFRGSGVDISERLKLEDALSESEEKYRALAENSADIIFSLDLTGTFTYISPQVSRYGYTPNEITGKGIQQFIYPDDQEIVLKNYRNEMHDGTSIASTFRIVDKQGSLHWIEENSNLKRDEQGNPKGMVGILRDVTDRVRAEDALAESEGKYRGLTENTGDILFSMDMTGIFTYISPQVNKYGFLAEEIIGKTLRDVIHPEDIALVENDLSRDLEKGAQFHSTFRVLDKWGHIHWFDEKGTLRLDQSGKPIGIYGVLRDDSERRRSENALGLANKKLNLMNNITRHDILNTITGIYGCVDMAKAAHSADEREPLLNDIKDLIMIIQRQITFTREYQEVGVNLPQWQNLNDLIHKTLQNFEKSGLTFSTEFEKTEIYADPLLEKVFYNLVDNAIRYGQTITTISIHTDTSDKGLSLVFKDDGVGVEVWQKQEIFKRGVGKNTGMGLFLTAEILAITGITIEENGVFGEGARFEIRIPNGTWRFPRD